MNRQAIIEAAEEDDVTRIYEVKITNKSIKVIQGLKEFDKIRCLKLSYNLIERIQNINYLADLRQLHLENNALTKMGGMENNPKMEVINLANNRIEKIQGIGHMPNLKRLMLDNNRINKLTGLDYLKELKSLSVNNNRIQNLESLPVVSKLESLSLSHNQIKNIPQKLFAPLKTLVSVDLSHNHIANTAFLMTLTSLEELNLSRNRIKELQVPIMPNLETLNLSENQIEKLPLGCLNIKSNFICSQYELLSSLNETVLLSQIDFRDNPMFTASFQAGLQKIYSFDFLNGKAMNDSGAKNYKQVSKIEEDLSRNSEWYGEDDEYDRHMKLSEFYDPQLQFRMSGMKRQRPQEKKKKRLDYNQNQIEESYQQLVQDQARIKALREHYLQICGKYEITSSPHILTEVPVPSEEKQEESPTKQEPKPSSAHMLELQASNVRKENEKNLNKWKELKQREKSFNIREVMKKPRGRESSAGRFQGGASGSNWQMPSATSTQIGTSERNRGEISRKQLFKTQLVGRKGDQLLKTMKKPSSMRRKD